MNVQGGAWRASRASASPSPYSPRAIDGAPVSAPLKWSEITKKLDPLKFNIRTMPNRLAKVGDLFAPVLEKGVKLPQLK